MYNFHWTSLTLAAGGERERKGERDREEWRGREGEKEGEGK